MRGAWDLIVACKGSLVVAWRRSGMRTGLAGLLAALAMVGAVGALWLLAGGGADDAAAPIDDGATLDRGDVEAGTTGPRRTVPAAPLQRPGFAEPGSADATDAGAGVDRAPGAGPVPRSEGSGTFRPSDGTGTDTPPVRPGGTTTAGPNRVTPSSSTTSPTAPPQSAPPDGTTTATTGPEAPPSDGSDAGLGGLLGGVLEVLGVG